MQTDTEGRRVQRDTRFAAGKSGAKSGLDNRQKTALTPELSAWLNSPEVPNHEEQAKARRASNSTAYRDFHAMAQHGYDNALKAGWRHGTKGSLKRHLAEKRAGLLTKQGTKDAPDTNGTSAETTKSPIPRTIPYPAVNADLERLPETTIPIPGGQIKVEITGALTIAKKGSVNPLTFDRDGYKVQAGQALKGLTTVSGISYSANHRNLSYTTGIQGDWSATTVSVGADGGTVSIVFETQPKPVSLTQGDWALTGTIGYRFTYNQRPGTPWYKEAYKTIKDMGEMAVDWIGDNAVALGLIAGGAAVVVFTIGEDVLTLGTGVVDDPVTIGAGTAMVGRGVGLIK